MATIRLTFGEPLARRQAIQWPLVELATEAQMLQALIRRTAAELDSRGRMRRYLAARSPVISFSDTYQEQEWISH